MILLDKSGSMAFPINPSDPNCPAASCPGPSCPGSCPTRISELRNAMATFLTANGTVARFGLTTFPADTVCGAAGSVRVELTQSSDVVAELQAKANEVNAAIQAIGVSGNPGSPDAVGGGTPVGPSLAFLGTYAPLKNPSRADVVLLLTDGLPNCNSQNPNNCTNATACRCTSTTCGSDMTAPLCILGCLDDAGATAAVSALRAQGIFTVVVGFGSDTASQDARASLNGMALAGGFARPCPQGTNAECGANDTCDVATKVCAKAFYQANNATELATALADIARVLSGRP